MTKTLYIILAFVLIANVAFLNWQFYKKSNEPVAVAPQNETVSAEIAEIKNTLAELKSQPAKMAATPAQTSQAEAVTEIEPQVTASVEYNLLKEYMTYKDGDVELEGYWAGSPCSVGKKQPVVVIFPHPRGVRSYLREMADKIADKKCFNVFAIDLIGKEFSFMDLRDNDIALKEMFKHRDVEYSRKRIKAAFDLLENMGMVDMDKIAVIGIAGGGQIAVREAFSGANYKAVSSFYNNLNTFPFPEDPSKVTAKVQIHISKDDSRNKPGLAESVKNKIKAMNIPVTFYEYEGEHFAIPNQYGEDSTYNAKADEESFERTMNMIKEALGQ